MANRWYLVVYEAVADPHHQEGEASVGGGEVDDDVLLAGALCLVDCEEVGTEIRTQPATVPRGFCQWENYSVREGWKTSEIFRSSFTVAE